MEGERIAKVIARAGICSRRDAERLIEAGKVMVDGKVISSPALNVRAENKIEVDGKIIGKAEETRFFLFHKPKGFVTTHKDEQGRETVFDLLPKNLPRLISVGRLDLNTEGLLLLTNDGELSRQLELPKTALHRVYKVRLYGVPDSKKLNDLKKGITIEEVTYGPITVEIDDENLSGRTSQNFWTRFTLTEGKNREIRKVAEHLDYQVSRLIRLAYGPFELGELKAGEIKEIPYRIVKEKLAPFL